MKVNSSLTIDILKSRKKFEFTNFSGFPIACEGDVDGALGCLVGKFLGCGTIYLSDWLEHDGSTITLWHGGMAPTQVNNHSSFTLLILIKDLAF